MFIKIDKNTLEEQAISSEEMVKVLENDMKPKFVDEALTDIVSGSYEHANAFATYKYKP